MHSKEYKSFSSHKVSANGLSKSREAVGNNLFSNTIRFNGERKDPVTGMYLLGNGYRAYNPAMARFNAPDSASPFGGGRGQCLCILLGRPCK